LRRDTARAMSQRDREMIASLRRGYEAFNRGDFDAAMAVVHPEIEFALPGRRLPLSGKEAVRAWMEPDAFEEQEIEPLEFTVKGDKVLVRTRVRARGAGSGMALEVQVCAVWTLDADGLATRVETFGVGEEAKALEAAGLRG
jgi:ketosteroid isomerase-like protein